MRVVLNACTAHRKDTEQCMKDVDGLAKTVFGNGKKGLTERMTVVETNLAAIPESIKITGMLIGIAQFITGMAVTICTIIFNAQKGH